MEFTFNNHPRLAGQHAFLGASVYHWTNYDDEKLEARYLTAMAAQRGTELHAHAANCIKYGTKLSNAKNTINLFVNDAIGFRMTPEQTLVYSENAFGTADAISFDATNRYLRIHDLKTGDTPASMRQLEIYEALFCLEYGYKPDKIGSELRIYQKNEKLIYEPDPKDIQLIMDKIVHFDKLIQRLKSEDF